MKATFWTFCLCGVCASASALPSFDPFTSATGLNANGTSYATGSALYHQTNAFGEGWALWNGGSGSATAAVLCVNSNLSYVGFPAGFPAPPSTNTVLIPGLAQGLNASGYNAALSLSRVISADPNNLVTNKIYASFLLTVPNIGDLATTGTEPIFFGGLNNSTAGDISTTTAPGKSFKLFLQGNSATGGASTNWAIGIADNSGGSTERFDPTFRAPNTVLFVVVDYEFGINGNNDDARLWVNPAAANFGAPTPPTPTATITITSTSGNELGQAAKFFLITRAGATLWGSILLGDLRLGTTWGFVTGGPEFTNQPASQPAVIGSTVTLNSGALAGGSPVAYQWSFNGTNLAGATLSSLTIANFAATNAGTYAVTVSNAVASIASSNAILSASSPDPGIVVPPQNMTIATGGSALFSVTPEGTTPFSYSWQFNGTNLSNGTLSDGAVISGSTTTNLTISNATTQESGNYTVIVSNIHGSVTSAPAVLTVTPPLLITSPLQSRVEAVGDNLAFVVGVNASASYQWQFNGTNIAGATASSLALTNIQTTNAGTYTVTASNLSGVVSNSATLSVSTGLLHLSPANLVVARVGDGAQPLSSSAGNTLYLDQFTTGGGYVSTIMIPNAGPPALIVPGTGDGIYESVLTLSANQEFLNFAGYNVSYPYPGADVTAGNVTVRGIGAVNGLGYYTLVLTNIGLYSGGNHFIRSAASTDGLTNFWTTGAAGSGGIKYIAPGLYPDGQGIPAPGGGAAGTRVAGIYQGSVVFSDSENNTTQTGINAFTGLPTSQPADNSLLLPTGASSDPNDFAISPDGNTVYIADDSPTDAYGIQRWDFDQVQWTLSYTLGTGSNSTVGARGLTVDFSQFTGDGADGSGAIIYATTAEPGGNRLISIVDAGPGSPATVLDTAGPNQMLRGLRFGPAAAEVLVDSPPQSQTNDLGSAAVFSVVVSGSLPISYQWQFNGSNIAGATLSSLTVSNIAPTNAGTYSVLVANDISTTSAAATLSVLVNTNAPILLAADSLGLTEVEVMLSAIITANSATNLANYAITGPGGALSILGVAQDSSGSNVVLTVAAMTNGTTYTINVSNLANAFATNSVLPPNSETNFIATGYVPSGIGTGQPTQITLSNGFIISATGSLLNGTSDQTGFSGQLQLGNFDISVCLAGLGAADVWSEAGLMARQSLDPGSPYAASIATPGMSGCFFDSRSTSNGSPSEVGSFPANIPNTWLRLSRVGALFTGYASYDGQTWTQLGSVSIAMTDPIYVGLAVTSNNTNAPTSAQFVNLGATPTNAVIGPNPNPHEALGPSSRKTGIVFSEIMYKPATRIDTNNCEFVEIYNSQPFFHDISGYQITCADMNYTFPSNTLIPAGGFLVIAASPGSIQNVYGITNVMGPYTGSLKKSETLELLDEQSNILLTVPYAATYPWPVAADGTGHSIVLANPSYGEGDPRAWDISDIIGGSPGVMESYRPSPLRNVVINEFLAHSENPAVPQFVELYNHSPAMVDISGCILTDDPANNLFVVPAGTTVAPGGFVSFNQTQLGFLLNGSGDTIYFIKPDGSRILDAVQFEPQADGVSFGRWPDGANDFYPFTAATPGTNNSPIAIGSIAINELMYDPISGNDDDQYIELYNAGTNTVSLANWQFTAGVTFTFPADAAIGPNGYVVVGRNTANLFADYTNLNSGNTFGNYTGKLSHNGERVALARPESYFGSNTVLVVEDEVTYNVGGRWGQWSSGNGSSLELIDPRSNHRLAANWTDSDDTQKSQWITISNTGVLDNGTNYTAGITFAQVGLLDVGECLMDNLQIIWQGTNYVTNSTFESGLGGWNFQGDHVRSSLEPSGYQSSQSLHVRSSDKYWLAENSCETLLPANGMAAGDTVTLQFQARWLHGWPEPILHLDGNWLEAYGAMPVPANLGSPGQPNSAYATNIGPAIYQVTHTPAVPAANQATVVTARIHDPDGVTNFTLFYRIDPSATYNAVPMVDNGAGGDAIPGDGVFSATIPGQAANVLVAFYIAATDGLGATTRFPALRPANNEPVRECLVLFGDGTPVSSLNTYHLWLTQTNVQRWINLADLSNEYMDCTFVNNNRVIYNMGARFTTSPAHQGFNSPVGKLCGYEWEMPDDDQFLGATSFHKIHLPGNGGLTDSTLQREATSYSLLRSLGQPWLYRRDVAVYVNGNRRGPLMEDVQLPNTDMVKEYFPNDTDGFLYKFDQWYEFAAQPSGTSIGYAKVSTHTLLPYTTTGGVKKVTRYRPMYQIRRTPDSMNDFTNIFSLVDAASSFGTPGYVANMENLANMENWMSVFAVNHAVGNWDVYGGETGQNLYGYIGAAGTKMTLMMWDMNIDLGSGGSWGAGANIFTSNVNDTNTENIFVCPAFRRMYWNAFERLINGQFSVAAAPLANAKYKAFANDNLGAYVSGGLEDPNSAMLPWIAQAQSSIASQLSAVDASQFSVNQNLAVTNDVAYVTGIAPVGVSTVLINGTAWPVTWTSLTGWAVAIPLQPGINQLTITGVDVHGQLVAGASGTASATNNQPALSPAGQVVINEIMYNSVVTNAEYIELYNSSTTNTFNLSGWQLPGVNYTFPAGSEIAPNGFLILAANGTAFADTYGATVPVFDEFSGTLQPGQTLTLLDAGSNVVTEMIYEDVPPWPSGLAPGTALELIDPTKDNWREGNWAGVSRSPGATNSVFATLPPFPPLWINEVLPDNLTGITNSAGNRAPWLELYNPGSNNVSLSGLYLSDNYANLTNWAFPGFATINAGQFLVVFADGQTNLNTPAELHAGFTLSVGAGSVALSRVYNGRPQVLDYVDYTNLPPNYSFGSFPDGQSFIREQFFDASPGATNNGSPPGVVPYLALNSIYAQNFDSLPDPGATTTNSDNPVTINGVTYSPANPVNFAASVANGGLGLSPSMIGWYGFAASGMKLGASAGDQSTGGIISFGTTDSGATNRALGLLATSSTGATAFGLGLINLTTNTIDEISLNYIGELWRQQPAAKTLSFSYYIDPTGSNAFSVASTMPLTNLDVNFPVGPFSAEDGTQPANQIQLAVTNQPILDWPLGAAFWLVWQMTNDAGNSQGLAIDNLSFSANSGPVPPIITAQPQSQIDFSGNSATLSVAAAGNSALTYQWQFNGNNIANATNSSLVISGLTAANAGAYDVLISDATGTTKSQPAMVTVVSHTFVAYTNAGAAYTQNFDALPNPGAATVDTANPVTIGSATYALPDPFDFGFPIQATGSNGGLGLLSSMPGWYGYGSIASKLGASAGDQTTGGIVSFGPTNNLSTNRSLGLLGTSTSGGTAFAVRILNQTPDTLTNMTLGYTGQLWRQQTTAKTLSFSYYVDLSGTNAFVPANTTAALPVLNVSFPTGAKAAGGLSPLMVAALGVTNQLITNCPPGAALWLTWQMTSATGSAQGLAIDNLSFSATGPQTQVPALSITQSNASVILSWPANITGYAPQFNTSSLSDTNAWQNVTATNFNNTVIVPITQQHQYFRLKR